MSATSSSNIIPNGFSTYFGPFFRRTRADGQTGTFDVLDALAGRQPVRPDRRMTRMKKDRDCGAPGARWTAEGRLDLLIDLGDGYAIIDHKSFPGSIAIDEMRLLEFAGQVSLYARAIKRVTGRTRFECGVHQPIAAVMLRIDIR